MSRDHESRMGERLAAADRRQSFVDAGWEILTELGLRAVKIDVVVSRVGVTRPMFYRHFRDRSGLLVALYERYADELRSRCASAYDGDGSLESKLSRMLDEYFDLLASYGTEIRALIEAARDAPGMADARARLRRDLTDQFLQALRSRARSEHGGALIDEDRRLEVLVEATQAAAEAAATAWLEGRATKSDAEEALAVLTSGLAERAVVALSHRRPARATPSGGAGDRR
jgi:AcrR family transcriptional regulator